MKKKFFIAVFAFALLSAPAVFAADSDFQSSQGFGKLDSGLQQMWIAYQNGGDGTSKVQCFLVASEDIDQGDGAMLLDAGFVVQVATGRIARGHLAVKDLPSITSVYFVTQVKLASK